MRSDKWVLNFFFVALVAGGLLAFFIVFTATAHASWQTPRIEAEAEQDQQQGQDQAQGQGQAQGQTATGTGTASASGTGSATNEGNNNTTNNNTRFFAFNSSIPSAGECFGAAQGGGGGSNGGGFLGINFLNKDCWYAKTAEFEESVEVRARLKCGSKAFRNAIAYDTPRRERQQACIGFMVQKMVEQLEYENAKIQDMLNAQTLLINDHTVTVSERNTEKLTRVVESCSDCFGEGSK
jgi:hypothetical protein